MNNLEYGRSLSKDKQLDFYGHASRTVAMGPLRDFADWLASEHIEPIVLTAEERKAAELAVAIGLPWISRCDNVTMLTNGAYGSDGIKACFAPGFRAFVDYGCNKHPKWITAEPIDLRELLKSQKSQKPEPENTGGLCRNCKHVDKKVSEPPCNICPNVYVSRFVAQDNG